jgi:hypothetical protein
MELSQRAGQLFYVLLELSQRAGQLFYVLLGEGHPVTR